MGERDINRGGIYSARLAAAGVVLLCALGWLALGPREAPEGSMEPAATTIPKTGVVAQDAEGLQGRSPLGEGTREEPARREPLSIAADRESGAPAARTKDYWFGRVTDRDGNPVPGATATVFTRRSWRRRKEKVRPLGESVTDLNGQFMIPVPARSKNGGEGFLFLEAPQHASRLWVVRAGLSIDATLPRAINLDGLVVDASTGAAIEGARVQLDEESTVTDRSGRYTIMNAPVGTACRIWIQHPDFVPFEERPVFHPTEREFRSELRIGKKLSLVTVDGSIGAPLGGVTVTLGSSATVLGSTDASGRAVLALNDHQDGELEFHAPGFALLHWRWKAAEFPAAEIQLPMRPLSWIEGWIRDEPGNLIPAGATTSPSPKRQRVVLEAEARTALRIPGKVYYAVDSADIRAARRSNAAGALASFRLPIVAPSGSFELSVFAKGHAPRLLGPFESRQEGETIVVETTLSRGGHLRGTVRYNGEPWNAGQVHFEARKGSPARKAVIDQHGNYSIADIAPGSGRVSVRAYVEEEWLQAPREVSITTNETLVVDFAKDEELVTLGGTVRYEDGSPAVGTPVSLHLENPRRSFSSSTTPDGRFEAQVLPGGPYRVAVYAGESTVYGQATAPDLGAVEIVLPNEELRTLSFAVVDPATGRRFAPSRSPQNVGWRPSGGGRLKEHVFDRDGIYTIETACEAIDLFIALTGDGFALHSALGVPTEKAGSDDLIFDVPLIRGTPIEIQLVGPNADLLVTRRRASFALNEDQVIQTAEVPSLFNLWPAGAHLWGSHPQLQEQQLKLDSSGKALIRALAPGSYRLATFPDDLAFNPPEFVVTGREPWPVTLRVRCEPR